MKKIFKIEIEIEGKWSPGAQVFVLNKKGDYERIGYSEWSGKVACGTYMPIRFARGQRKTTRFSNYICIGNYSNGITGAFGIIKKFLWK